MNCSGGRMVVMVSAIGAAAALGSMLANASRGQGQGRGWGRGGRGQSLGRSPLCPMARWNLGLAVLVTARAVLQEPSPADAALAGLVSLFEWGALGTGSTPWTGSTLPGLAELGAVCGPALTSLDPHAGPGDPVVPRATQTLLTLVAACVGPAFAAPPGGVSGSMALLEASIAQNPDAKDAAWPWTQGPGLPGPEAGPEAGPETLHLLSVLTE